MASVSKVLLILLIICGSAETLNWRDLVLIFRSQPNTMHQRRSADLDTHLLAQMDKIDLVERPIVEILDDRWYSEDIGYWAVWPILSKLEAEYGSRSWLLLFEDDTRVNLTGLVKVLQKYDPLKMQFLGKPLRDETTTIIHHFAFAENPRSFAYPDFGGGAAFSMPLIRWLCNNTNPLNPFVIDVQHEIAKLIYEEGGGLRMTDIPEFCTIPREGCVSELDRNFPECGHAIPVDELFVAVKTCHKFHQTRVPIVKSTWGKETPHIEYYSDVADPSIPTINLGVVNTERGHCGKTRAILKRAIEKSSNITQPWLLLADDDTIINLERLRKLLACYNSSEVIHMGERYGYSLNKRHGYGYITGGGGIVFSRAALLELKDFDCPNDAPDDMSVGRFLERMGFPPTHSMYFHQGRLEDYSPDFLAGRLHISFHKHWNNDPLKTYAFLTRKEKGPRPAEPAGVKDEL